MPHSIHKLFLTGLIFTSTQLYAADYDFTPGLWELTTTSEGTIIDATPEMKQILEQGGSLKPATYTNKACFIKFNLLDNADGDDCPKNIKRINANHATFESNCNETNQPTHSVGEFHLNGKTFTFTQEMESYSDDMSLKTTMTGSGKYLGPCK